MTTLITIPQSPIALHTLSWPGPKDGSTNSAKGILSCGISGCKDLPFLDLQDNLLKVPCRWPTDPSPKHIQKSFHIFPHHPSIPRYSKYSTPSLPPSFRVTAPRAPDICTATTHLGHAATRSNAQHVEVHRGSSVCSQGAVAKFRLAIAGPRWHHLRQRLVEIVPHTFARKTKNNQKDAILNEVLMTYFNWLQLTSS